MTSAASEEKEEWIFSLFLPKDKSPPSSSDVVQLVTSQNTKTQYNLQNKKLLQQQRKQQKQRRRNDGDNDDDDDDVEDQSDIKKLETKSLLDDDDDDDGDDDNVDIRYGNRTSTSKRHCWTFQSPTGMVLESSVLLRLSYRPVWQGIPEYTNTSTSSSMMTPMCMFCSFGGEIACCCCTGCSNPKALTDQIEEVYTTQQIVDTTTSMVSIRGLGLCRAVHVYIQPMSATVQDHWTNTPTPLKPVVGRYEARSKGQQVQQQRGGTRRSSRFTEEADDVQLRQQELVSDADGNNLIVITFAMPNQTEHGFDPPLLWKVQLPPPPDGHAVLLDTITVLDANVNFSGPRTAGNYSSNNNNNAVTSTPQAAATHAYVQGYQSWTYTGSISKGRKQPKPSLPNLYSRAFNLGGKFPPTNPSIVVKPSERGQSEPGNSTTTTTTTTSDGQKRFYKSDFFTCITSSQKRGASNAVDDDDEVIMDEIGGPAFLCGWLSQHEQFGTVAIDDQLKTVELHASHDAMWSYNNRDTDNGGPSLTTDWAYTQWVSPHHYDEEPMVHYLHAVAAFNQARPLQNGPLMTGWCSWYHYMENISEGNLRSNFASLNGMKNKFPSNVAVVDDGYMTAWGDWDSFKPGKFTDMSIVARDIKAYGMRPGIWLAPFACDKHSKVAKEHPDWIIRNDQGAPANSSNCGKFFFGLDATNPNAREHVYEAIRRAVHDWGYEVLKIDFLYAACLEGNGKYDLSMSRAQAMHLALQTIRDAAGPDVYLIGCGCPIGTGIGYVDGMRVSADTGPSWYTPPPLPWWDNGTLPSLRGMVRNTLTRAPMGHRWWHNDPDCLMIGETTSYTMEEVISSASIVAMTCGMMLVSDDLTQLSPDRMKILTKVYPMTGVSAVVLDLHNAMTSGVSKNPLNRSPEIPSLLRLWCTDRYSSTLDQLRKGWADKKRPSSDNVEATHFGRQTSFAFGQPTPHPNERKRSCIHVAKGLGTWTAISLSNWTDAPKLMRVPRTAVIAAPETGWRTSSGSDDGGGRSSGPLSSYGGEKNQTDTCEGHHGYHVFSFWSGRYNWISIQNDDDDDENTNNNITSGSNDDNGDESSKYPIVRRLEKHETEIFHIRPVTPGTPQYIGSDLHFSCGHEVLSFDIHNNNDGSGTTANKVSIQLKTELQRTGYIYIFLPVVDMRHVQVQVAGRQGKWTVIGGTVPKTCDNGQCQATGRIIGIEISIIGDDDNNNNDIENRSELDGYVEVDY